MPVALSNLPEDTEALKALVATLLGERDLERRRAEEQARRAEEQKRVADDLHIEILRLQVELARYKKQYYGPRADHLQTEGELAQMLLRFAEALDHKPVNPDDVPAHSEPEEELRRVKRRKGRRNLANFENLPVTTHIYELHGEQRACRCCGLERDVTGRQESWQIEYYPGHFERLHHVRMTYACKKCEQAGENPQMETAAKPASAIEKGLAAPGLLSYIVTSKFAVYVPLYRLEDIFARQGFEISRTTQSVWCGDVADLVEPLWELMAERVRASHVVGTDDTIMPMQNPGKTANARMWVYVGDHDHPYTVFDFTLNRGRDGPKYFLRDYNQVLLADAYGGYNGVVAGNAITRAGCWAHLRRRFIDAEKVAPEIAREAIEMVRLLYAVEKQAKDVSAAERLALRQEQSAPVLAQIREKLFLEGAAAAQAPHGRGRAIRSEPMAGAERVLFRRRGRDRQQRQRTRNEARGFKSKEQPLRRQSTRRKNGSYPGQHHLDLPSA